MLGGHVRGCADGDAGRRDPRLGCGRARDSEVCHERSPRRAIDENVVWLDVPVNDPTFMCVRERIRDVAQHARDSRDRPGAFASQTRSDAFAIDQAHDEIDDGVFFVDAVNRHDVWMRQLRRRLRFADEPGADIGVERELRRQHLERNGPMQAQVERAIYDGHAAATDLALDQILCADRDRHAVEQRISHSQRAGDAPAERAPTPRAISSATKSALSTLSASESASIASDVTC